MINPLSAATQGLIAPTTEKQALLIGVQGLLIFQLVVITQPEILESRAPKKGGAGRVDENGLTLDDEEVLMIIKAFLICRN